MKKAGVTILILASIGFAFKIKAEFGFKSPDNWPKPAYNFSNNPLADEKVFLGRVLFYDPILSLDSTISCSSCHLSYVGFTHVDHSLSHGIFDRVGTRNSPVLINLAWNKYFMWDGAVNHLDVQALAPISHESEMNEKPEHVLLKLNRSRLYAQLFKNAFEDSAITGERTLKALSQFMLTLVSNNAKYDSVKRGESHFTEQEQHGYDLFRNDCSKCHTEPLFTNGEFENNKLPVDTLLKDEGRFKITGYEKDKYKFKVPTLRNIEFSYPYMHDGRFKTLSQVMEHYTQKSGYANTFTSIDKVDLIAFLLTLSDKNFLFNPDHAYPREILKK